MADGALDDAPAGEESALDRARDALATAVRRLGHAVAAHELSVAEAEELAGWLGSRAAELERRPRREKHGGSRRLELYRAVFERDIERLLDEDGVMRVWRNSPVSGSSNPLGVGLEISLDGEEAVAVAHLGSAWEGAPERAHGGVLAAICDELMGAALTLQGEMGFTGRLQVRYLAPTPVESDVEFRARVVERKGRRLVAEAVGHHEGVKVVEAKGLFISMSQQRRRQLAAGG